jgi:hypothetical protein
MSFHPFGTSERTEARFTAGPFALEHTDEMPQAGQRVDVKSTIVAGRQCPCICPRQWDEDYPPRGRPFAYSESRGITVERVACSQCPRTWSRIVAT